MYKIILSIIAVAVLAATMWWFNSLRLETAQKVADKQEYKRLYALASYDIDAFLTKQPLSEQAKSAALDVIKNLRIKQNKLDVCVPEYVYVYEPLKARRFLLEQIKECSNLREMNAHEISTCAATIDKSRCEELIRAWNCLHEALCEKEVAEAMDSLIEGVDETYFERNDYPDLEQDTHEPEY